VATKAPVRRPEVPLPPLVAKAKLAYDAELSELNDLRNTLNRTMEAYQRGAFKVMRARARYVRLAKKYEVEAPGTPWWEKEVV